MMTKTSSDRQVIRIITVSAVALVMLLFCSAPLYKAFMRRHYICRFEALLRLPAPEKVRAVKYGILLDKTHALHGMPMEDVRKLFDSEPMRRPAFLAEGVDTVWCYGLGAGFVAVIVFRHGAVCSFSVSGEEGCDAYESQLPAPYSLRSW